MLALLLVTLLNTGFFFSRTTPPEIQTLGARIVIPAGTEVIVSPAKTVFSNTVVEREILEMVVVDDVQVNGRLVIQKGAIASARVAIAEPPASFGRRGRLVIEMINVTAINGSKIDILGEHSGNARGRGNTAAILTILAGPLGGRRIEGSPARIESTTRLKATTEREVTVEIKP